MEPRKIQTADLNPDVTIGIALPFGSSQNRGILQLTNTSLEQARTNLMNLLLTRKGERVMQPNFGTNIQDALFEQNTSDLQERLISDIEDSVNFWLSYIRLNDISINNSTDGHTLTITIQYSLKNDSPSNFESITLEVQVSQ